MSEIRTRSDDRSLAGYGIQEESKTTPNGFRGKRNPGREGMGREGVENGKSRTRENIVAWIAANLPGENYHAVGAVTYRLKKQGKSITAESVREGLRERGWLKEERE